MTTGGPVNERDIRLICPHEHLLVDLSHEAVLPKNDGERAVFDGEVGGEALELLRRNPYVVRSNLILDSEDLAVRETEPLKKFGCNLLVDVTSVGLGRDIRRIHDIARKSGIHVTAGCGFFVRDSLPDEYLEWDAGKICDYIMREINSGIDGTNIKPGVIGEIGVSENIHPFERQSLEGAASAAAQSGLPLYLHIYPWSHSGLEAVRILLENGAEPGRICVCHLDVSFDLPYILRILETGVYVEFDNFGKEFYFEPQEGSFAGGPFETDISRVRMLKHLCGLGFASRLLPANDVCLKALLRRYGGNGYCHVFENIRPMLESENIEKKYINLMFEQNPRRFLFGE